MTAVQAVLYFDLHEPIHHSLTGAIREKAAIYEIAVWPISNRAHAMNYTFAV